MKEIISTTDRFCKTLLALKDTVEEIHHKNLLGNRDIRKIASEELKHIAQEYKRETEVLLQFRKELLSLNILIQQEHLDYKKKILE